MWTHSCQDAFDKLKEMFTRGPILTHFDDTRPRKLKTDTSDFALGAVLSQLCEDEKWHPVAFDSRQFSPAEINYDVHDQEMAAIVAAFKEWAYRLMLVDDRILGYTDHKNLEYFNNTKTLNRRQHPWAEFLQPFNFKVIYKEGLFNEKANALSRHRDYRPEGGSNSEPLTFFRPAQYIREDVILRPHVLQTCQGFQLQTTVHQALMKAADCDETYVAILKELLKGDSKVDTNFTIEKDLLLYKNRWYIPKDESLRRTIMEAEHDSNIAGQFRTYKTIGRIRPNFDWPKMDENITEYFRSCDVCQRNKVIQHKMYGLLQLLEVSMRPWTAISMNFIVGLSKADGYTKIWVIVDRFSKMAHFIPVMTEENIKELALTFLKEIWHLHGLPESIVSDRDTQLTSKFWTSLMQLLYVKLNLSTSFHPESDGATERVNQILQQYWRSYCSYQQEDWVSLLPFSEHVYNTSMSESAMASLFEINYGFSPQTQWS